MSLLRFTNHMILKVDKEIAHKCKKVTDLKQRVVERKKKYVRYQEEICHI